MITADQVLNEIKGEKRLLDACSGLIEYLLPEPYYPPDKSKIKALVLGTDPSNFSKDNKTVQMATVFDIGKDQRYFAGISRNLELIGLSLENVFVQNMVRNYMNTETRSNPLWDYFAVKWFQYIHEELDSIDPQKKLPVFITSERLLKFLLNDPFDIGIPNDYYDGTKDVPLSPEDNKFERFLIPLYRHPNYSLDKQELYKNRLIELFKPV
jgi:hypothetical protein